MTNTMTKKDIYDINSAEHISAMQYIRMRPRFYLGNSNVFNTALREVSDNAFDEIIKGYASHVTVTFHGDHSVSVLDDGRGVPAEGVRKNADGVQLNAIQFLLGQPMAGTNFSNSGTTSAGTNGVGSSATNAISRRFDVTSYRNGKEYHQSFKDGEPVVFTGDTFDPDAPATLNRGKELKGTTTSHPDGTLIRCLLDETLEPDDAIDIADLLFRLHTMCRLTDGSHLAIRKDDSPVTHDVVEDTYDGPWGIIPTFHYVFDSEDTCSDPFVISGKTDYSANNTTLPVEFDIAFTPSKRPEVYSFVNGVYSPDGGSHHTSVVKALGDVLEERGAKLRGLSLKKGEEAPKAEHYVSCLSAIISVRTPSAPYTSQDKCATKSVPLANAMRTAVGNAMSTWVNQTANTSVITTWANQALTLAREDQAIKLAKERAKKTSAHAAKLGENMRMPVKLLPSRNVGPGSGAELFICEGDSAASALKAARDAEFQAIFPIRGKILNVYDMSPVRALKNQEISDIVTILGAGVGRDFDVSRMRYDRIIFAFDADQDGFHIGALLLTMCHVLFRGLIESGRVFIAQPPLFIVSKGREKIYCLNETEKRVALKKLGKGATLTREKGLGETDSASLNDTLMNPSARVLVQVKNDVHKSREYGWDTFFGKDTEARKEWLTSLEGWSQDDATF